MKRVVVISLVMVTVAMLTVSCVPQGKYDVLMGEYDAAQAEITSLSGDLATAQDKALKLEGDLSAEQSKTAKLESDLEAEKSKTEKLEGDLSAEQSKAAKLESDVAAAQSTVSGLKSSLAGVQSKLDEINKVYPPRHFSTLQKLQDWLNENGVSDRAPSEFAEDLYKKALDIQEAALEDGYIISAYVDYYPDEELFVVLCEAVADGYVYAWDPETDEILGLSEASGLQRVR